ncbi:hypothetical protein L3V59_01975 [Burkholderia aenigmatica]|uniref:hypothetical protein n=1 Tax=Burkholderia aenigmatica TaxID=2015348 RepID=UPI001F397298|nr:hypothetical protein [Burkholderia aenigmatica]UKD11862.1 hypothetical protein L3V59_01975 [Burkholderia aenigmatica]
MERKLVDYPMHAPLVRHIYDELIHDHFEELVRQGLAAPSTASEYRAALRSCLCGEAVRPIPDEALMNGYVFEIGGHKSDGLSIEVPIFSEGGRSDAFMILRVKKDNAARPTLYLYDILVP